LQVEDASHRPHRLHATLSAAQEAVVVALRETLLLPLDDLLAVTRESSTPEVSRFGLDRCLRRHSVSNLKTLMPQEDGAKNMVRNLPIVSAPPASASPRVPTRLIASAPPTASNIA